GTPVMTRSALSPAARSARHRPVHRRPSAGPTRQAVLVSCLAGLALALSALLTGSGPAGAAIDSRLVRYPYLTDLTSSSVQITFDTTVKITSANGAVRWGTPSGSTGCTLTSSSVSK